MRKYITCILAALIIAGAWCGSSYGDPVKVGTIVDTYYKETDLQREGVSGRYKDDMISAAGTVENVTEDATFDIVNDIKRRYYKVVTGVQNSPGKNPYRVILIYKELDRVKDISKGERIEKEGRLLRLVDERLFLSVWLYEEELSPEEKGLFK